MSPLYLTEADVGHLADMRTALDAVRGAFVALGEGTAENVPRRRASTPTAMLHGMHAAAGYSQRRRREGLCHDASRDAISRSALRCDDGRTPRDDRSRSSGATANGCRVGRRDGTHGTSRSVECRPLRHGATGEDTARSCVRGQADYEGRCLQPQCRTLCGVRGRDVGTLSAPKSFPRCDPTSR